MIYVFRAEGTDLYKVGYTARDPQARRQEWETGCPFPLEYLGAAPGKRADEQRLHARLKREGKWVSEAAGQEWFRLDEADVDEILGGHRETAADRVMDAAQEAGQKLLRRQLNKVARRKSATGLAARLIKTLWR